MTPKIILQNLVENQFERFQIPVEWQYFNLDKFGLNWELFPYQKQAVENCINFLYLIFNGWQQNSIDENKKTILDLYKNNGMDAEFENSLAITENHENFEFLSQFFQSNRQIPFESFLNRAAFWMATGSGKTLVMIKILAVLGNLIDKKLIPQKDILILAPKDEILAQIIEHVDIFNKSSEITINLKNLKDYEKTKNQQSIFSKNEITVFYYRADNISSKKMTAKKKDGQRLDYESIYNNGNWYIILDEAHKGDKKLSSRQQYYMLLAKNGFLFNFSATFTDDLDIATTIFDYKLDTFLKDGYGKMLYVADSQFQNFNKKIEGDDFSEKEKKDIIVQSLLTLALAKKHFYKLRNINNKLYHSPLLITLANSVNTEEADLKIFYKLLAEIAIGDFDFTKAKNNLAKKLEENDKYLFDLGCINLDLILEIKELKESDFREAVFNTKMKSNIEVVKFRDNQGELAFKMVNSEKYFMLIRASDIIKWEDNTLSGYEFGKVIEESFFEDINKRNDINILLGSRVFTEGWDSNRPNIINFINIGVSDEAKKYVLQSIGRGIRIEPMPNIRKRFNNSDCDLFSKKEKEEIEKTNEILESLFIFATNKEVVKNILEGLEKQSNPEWVKINGAQKNENIREKELPIFIPAFDNFELNEKPFWIGENEFVDITRFTKKTGAKVLLLKNGIKIRTYKKILDKKNFSIGERRRKKTSENIIFVANSYFNEFVKKLSEIKILDGEISHYKEIKTNIGKEEALLLEKELSLIIKPKKSKNELLREVKEGKITDFEYENERNKIDDANNPKILKKYLDFKILEEHYYSPILFKEDSKRFQHIITEKSEIEFIEELKNYLELENNHLKNFDWWFFSKIEQRSDKIEIPYFDNEAGKYRTFFPDFIFWLKKDNKYYLKFIDPHGVEHIGNTTDKIDGFNDFTSDILKIKIKNISSAELFFYNENSTPHGLDSVYQKYFTSDFDKMFICN